MRHRRLNVSILIYPVYTSRFPQALPIIVQLIVKRIHFGEMLAKYTLYTHRETKSPEPISLRQGEMVPRHIYCPGVTNTPECTSCHQLFQALMSSSFLSNSDESVVSASIIHMCVQMSSFSASFIALIISCELWWSSRLPFLHLLHIALVGRWLLGVLVLLQVMTDDVSVSASCGFSK